jgi:hypothetical protein
MTESHRLAVPLGESDPNDLIRAGGTGRHLRLHLKELPNCSPLGYDSRQHRSLTLTYPPSIKMEDQNQ